MVVASTDADVATWARLCSGCKPMLVHMSPNCTSRSTAATRPGKRMASAAARLVATAVLPEPPLGDSTTMTLPVLSGRGQRSVSVVAPLPDQGDFLGSVRVMAAHHFTTGRASQTTSALTA